MVDFSGIFGRGNRNTTDTETIFFELSVKEKAFVQVKLTGLYKNILTECYARSTFKKEFNEQPLFDNALSSEQQIGLISILAKAMYEKAEIKLVCVTGVVRLAERTDKDPIVCNFKNYELTDLLKMYYGFLYSIFETCNTGLRLGRSVQIKIDGFRKLLAINTAAGAKEQGNNINTNLKEGKGVLIDAADKIEAFQFQIATVAESALFISKEIAGAIRMPISFITGEQTTGISATGEADNSALENGLKIYFNSIFKPVVEKLFKTTCMMKTNMLKKIQAYAPLIPFLESTNYIDEDQKKLILKDLFE